jgi:chromosome segregation ATPase
MKRLVVIVPAVMLAASIWLFVAAKRNQPAPAPPQTSAVDPKLKERIAELEEELARMEEAVEAAGVPRPTMAPRPTGAPPTAETPAELLRVVEEKDRTIAGQDQTIAALREKLDSVDKQLAEIQKQQESEAKRRDVEWKEKLEVTERQSKQLLADLEARNARLRQIEAANLETRRQTEETLKGLTRLRQVSEELDTLTRRREGYMNNILGRYREATDLFRTMTVRLDSMREGTAVAGNDLSRIQNAITLADEDLRQLRSLQTRASQLQKDVQQATQTLKKP